MSLSDADLTARLTGKAAIVTGASRGIGAAAARELARHGVAVALVARSAREIAQIAEEIHEDGGRALAIAGDVARFGDMEEAARRCREVFGRIDILVNNAGVIDPVARLSDADPAAWGQVIDINLKGVFHGIRAVLPAMLAQSGGTILNISSGAATSPLEGWSHYCASKAGVLMLTRMVQKEYGGQGIQAVGLSPGTVATEMQRVIKSSGVNPVSAMDWEDHIPPDWPARAIAWLCAEGAAEFAGADFSIKTDEARRRVGLIA